MKALLFDPIRYLAFFLSVILIFWLTVGIANDNFIIYRFLNYFAQYVLLIVSAITLLCFYKKYKLLLIINLSLFGILFLNIFIFSEQPTNINSTQSKKNTLSVVSFSKMSRNDNFKELANIIDCNEFDLIVVQEIPDFDTFISSTDYKRNCFSVYNENVKKAVFSKFTIEDRGNLGANQLVDISIGKEIITVINVRLDKGIFNSQMQIMQADSLAKAIKKIDNKLIVLGDFNSTEFNYPYKVMTTHLNDSLREVGFNFSQTFPGKARRIGMLGPLIRIDYIFHQGFFVESAYVIDRSYGSDHYPVYTKFSF